MNGPATLRCAVCEVELTTIDAEMAVSTDAGPVHRECFQGPVPPGSPSADELLEQEEERRRELHDVPLPSSGETFDTYDPADARQRQMEREQDDYGGRYDSDGMVY